MRRLLLTLLPCLLLSGCGAAGDFCHGDSDCPSGLVCSASGTGKRGVCTYRVKANADAGAAAGDAAAGAEASPGRDMAGEG